MAIYYSKLKGIALKAFTSFLGGILMCFLVVYFSGDDIRSWYTNRTVFVLSVEMTEACKKPAGCVVIPTSLLDDFVDSVQSMCDKAKQKGV